VLDDGDSALIIQNSVDYRWAAWASGGIRLYTHGLYAMSQACV
jgi:hypothetical protein